MTEATGQDFTEMTLENLGHGAAAILWQNAMNAVLKDIDDPNTEPKTVRKITLELTIKPTNSRRAADMSMQVKYKLAGHRGVEGAFLLSRGRDGQLRAHQGDARQMEFDNPAEAMEAPATTPEEN